MNCEQCNTRMTRTAVGLMCLACGQLEHAPAEPETQSAVRIERIAAEPATVTSSSSGSIDGLSTTTAAKKSLIRPRIDQSSTQVRSEHPAPVPMPSNHARQISRSNSSEQTKQLRPAKFVAAGIAGIAIVVAFSWLSLRANQKTPLKTSSLANLSATKTAQPTATSASSSTQSLNRDKTRKQDLTQLATALNVYHKQTGVYPTGQDVGALLSLQTTSPPYLQQIPQDPLTGANGAKGYFYQYHSDGQHFTLQALLENSHDPQARAGYFVISD